MRASAGGHRRKNVRKSGGGGNTGGGTIQDNGKYLGIPTRQDKILLRGGGEETISASSKQVDRITLNNSFI